MLCSLLRQDHILNQIFSKVSSSQMLFGDFEILFEMSKNKELIVELGTARGLGAIVLSLHGARVYTIDSYNGLDKGNYMIPLTENESKKTYNIIKEYLKLWGDICVVRKNTKEAYKLFEDQNIDLLYIDAGHNYNEVKMDFDLWFPKVKKEGFILFHDYSVVHYDVKKFIDEEMKLYENTNIAEEINFETFSPTVIKIFKKIKEK